ncbi:Cytochrome c biogenesis CcmF C-terminal-like mitochondrial protein [Vigna angularis]|nr:Cytochrome c biogenesis CcmF C-terminal-like mitochondrial protein [Vigna angularis]
MYCLESEPHRIMVRLRSTNTKKIQFTQRLPLGSELHMGKEYCCFRGLDHLHGPTSHSICGNLMIYKPSLTNDRLKFEHDESLRADLLPINFPASYENGKLENFLHQWMKNHEHNNFLLIMFQEKRYFRETTSMTEVAIHTNPFTDRYASIGTGSSRTGGCLSSFYRYEMQYPLTFLLARLRDGKRFPAPRETWHLINRIGSKLGVDGLGDSRVCSIEAEAKERSYSLKVRMKRKEQRRRGYNLAWESI